MSEQQYVIQDVIKLSRPSSRYIKNRSYFQSPLNNYRTINKNTKKEYIQKQLLTNNLKIIDFMKMNLKTNSL